jgi:hypothetical protein
MATSIEAWELILQELERKSFHVKSLMGQEQYDQTKIHELDKVIQTQ